MGVLLVWLVFTADNQVGGNYSPVIPAKAGIHQVSLHSSHSGWIPAFAGMTGEQLRIQNTEQRGIAILK
jgi:hypothetical protein